VHLSMHECSLLLFTVVETLLGSVAELRTEAVGTDVAHYVHSTDERAGSASPLTEATAILIISGYDSQRADAPRIH
jgi:hypothetical protein